MHSCILTLLQNGEVIAVSLKLITHCSIGKFNDHMLHGLSSLALKGLMVIVLMVKFMPKSWHDRNIEEYSQSSTICKAKLTKLLHKQNNMNRRLTTIPSKHDIEVY